MDKDRLKTSVRYFIATIPINFKCKFDRLSGPRALHCLIAFLVCSGVKVGELVFLYLRVSLMTILVNLEDL